MSDWQDPLRAALGLFGAKHGPTQTRHAKLGRGDGSTEIIAAGAAMPYSVWIYTEDTNEGRKIATAILPPTMRTLYSNNTALRDLPVVVGKPANSGHLMILDSENLETLQSGGAGSVTQQFSTYNTYVTTNRIVAFSLVANVGLNVYVNPSPYNVAYTGELAYFDGSVESLTSPATGQQMALLCFNTVDRGINVYLSANIAGNNKGDFGYSDIVAMPVAAEEMICGAVHLYAGQASIAAADIYTELDPRPLFHCAAIHRSYLFDTFTTIDATPVVITAITIDATSGKSFNLTVNATNDVGTSGCVISGLFGARRAGGGAVLVGTPSLTTISDFGSPPAIAVGVSGNTLTLTATGIATTTINWKWRLETI